MIMVSLFNLQYSNYYLIIYLELMQIVTSKNFREGYTLINTTNFQTKLFLEFKYTNHVVHGLI